MFIGPTGGCTCLPVGAYLGARGSIWYHCRRHRLDVVDLITEHCDAREFPLQDISVGEAQVHEVMVS